MAALYACQIDNVIVDMNAEEVPILDGSAQPIIERLKDAGRVEQQASRNFLRIKKTVSIIDGDAEIIIEPHNSFSAEYKLVLTEIRYYGLGR